jgi:Domain of unknown function (DUF4405)
LLTVNVSINQNHLKKETSDMKLRRLTSLTALIAFVIMLISSMILYIVPQGRIAYWANWQLFGLTKEQWGDIHINTGLLFLLCLGLHLYYNWKPILSYLKDKSRNLKIFTKEFNLALIIGIVFVAGSLLMIPPFSWVLNVSSQIKDAAAVKYGEPPYGHAELSSLKSFTQKMGIDLKQGLARLEKADIAFESAQQSLKDLALNNRMSPQAIYLILKPEADTRETVKKMPDNPQPGLGKRSVADICQQYGLNLPMIIKGLAKNNMDISADQTMKEIAAAYKQSPVDIYALIRELSLQ